MGKRLYVGNLPFSQTDETLVALFAEFGTVESAKVITIRNSGRSKGFGFVEMSTEEEALSAIENMNEKEVEGRNLTVNEAKPMERNDHRDVGAEGY
ncbi:MAG: RNA-binding protein [Spirochaetia bacterium]|jgi:RNA recognition motif-containing protein|nr:RNA-binding protein [Spirochaetia bacterium]